MKRLIASIGLALVAGSALAGGIPDSITTTKGETLTVPESIKKCMTCHLAVQGDRRRVGGVGHRRRR